MTIIFPWRLWPLLIRIPDHKTNELLDTSMPFPFQQQPVQNNIQVFSWHTAGGDLIYCIRNTFAGFEVLVDL